jgi:hypothetical protein
MADRTFKAPPGSLVTSCRIESTPAHDRVRIWSRHGLAGELTVQKGDGLALVQRLAPDAVEEPGAVDPPIVHGLRYGWALCGRDGNPSDWPAGHRWVNSFTERDAITCEDCARQVAAGMRRLG